MTLPQAMIPGTTYFLTVACERREARLRPTAETNAAFAVAIEEARERTGVVVTAVTTVVNHYHAVVYDPWGRIADFKRDLHAVMARFGNARDGARGISFWERGQTSCQVVGDIEALVRKVAYTIANPTTSFLVARPEEWQGIGTRVDELGSWRGPVFRRPARFFREDGMVSELVELASELPPMALEAYGVEGFRARVQAEVERLVAAAQAEAAARGSGFMGMDKVLSLSTWSRPSDTPSHGVGLAAEARHVVAASERGRERQMLEWLAAFRRRHREALARFRRGLRAVFPGGTWFAWRYYGAERSAEGTPWATSTA